jgi:hypothetical protein
LFGIDEIDVHWHLHCLLARVATVLILMAVSAKYRAPRWIPFLTVARSLGLGEACRAPVRCRHDHLPLSLGRWSGLRMHRGVRALRRPGLSWLQLCLRCRTQLHCAIARNNIFMRFTEQE